MTSEKYDKVVWRINGTLILITCLGAILACTLVGYKILKEIFSTQYAHDIVNIDQNTKKEEYLRLGYFQPLKGTDFILIPLNSEQKYESSYYSKETYGNARNYLIFNTKTKESSWVWKSNAFLALQETKVYDQINEEKNQKTTGIVFEIVETDSNSNGLLEGKDQKTIQYFDLNSKKSLEVISKVDRVIGVQQAKEDEVLLFYSRAGKSYFKGLTLSSLSFSEEKEINLPR